MNNNIHDLKVIFLFHDNEIKRVKKIKTLYKAENLTLFNPNRIFPHKVDFISESYFVNLHK